MLQICMYIPTSNKGACGGLPGNYLKNLLRNPIYNNAVHDNYWTMTQLICSSAGTFC